MASFNPTTCAQVLQQAGLSPACDPLAWQYAEDSPWIHQYCAQSPSLYTPFQFIGCYNSKTNEWHYDNSQHIINTCLELHNADPNWNLAPCYLCCYLPMMPVATAGGTAALGTLAAGDRVLVGSLENGKPQWSEQPLVFSESVTGLEQRSPLIRIAIGAGTDQRALSFPADQVVVLADGTLTTADRLAPGQQLMGQNGQPVSVATAETTPDTGRTHYLAVTTHFDGKVDGHLLALSGIIVGDYTLQLHFARLPPAAKAAGYEAQPRVGTSEHASRYPQPVPSNGGATGNSN